MREWRFWRNLSMRAKLIISTIICAQLAWLVAFSLWMAMVEQGSVIAPAALYLLVASISGVAAALLSYFASKNLAASLHAFEVGLLNFKDNDFSVTLPSQSDAQLNRLCELFNESAISLREQRQFIYQREMLLDKVIQSSANIMFLLDDSEKVIYANDAARHFFNQGVAIAGFDFETLTHDLTAEFKTALTQPKGGLFSFEDEAGEPQTWHLSRGRFLLNGQYHHLYLLKQMTQDLNRQEVAVWKKVIRIISHELNNSLAPIVSMVNSGRMLTRELDDEKLALIFDTIEDRAEHLSQFIFSYARFAKLAKPNKRDIDWKKLMNQLAQHYAFRLPEHYPEAPCQADLVQLEQVLLNLLKNAHESGSSLDDIAITLEQSSILTVGSEEGVPNEYVVLKVSDRGPGMSVEVQQQALLPFYSTKQTGTGLGLALSKEIIEAHDGNISLRNRDGGGLEVSLALPV
ncbi:sensor histidine kinase [Corallincola platygyrae]|uniref:histidine kinase n=1 Tax=Corallincola platygyrae TaxID=1193278 RepID=A0ABW4XKT3_9GAMM